MSPPDALPPVDMDNAPKPPPWAQQGAARTPEALAFRAGAVLSALHHQITRPEVPTRLLGNQLALRAAVATSRLEGRLACEAQIRDAFHLCPPGDARGPDGDLLAFWRTGAGLHPKANPAIQDLVGPDWASDAAMWLAEAADRAAAQTPLSASAWVLEQALRADDRAERRACLLADIALSRALGWPCVVPFTATAVTKGQLRDLVAQGAPIAPRLLAGLEARLPIIATTTARAAALRAVAPKLRAKASGAVVALFLAEDTVVPGSMLSPVVQGSRHPMTARAARRICDRLVSLGVVKELSGRATFRLYGL